jgi:hypothetical protein
VRFILTGRKLNLRRFRNAKCLNEFDRAFDRERDRRLLRRLGFAPAQVSRLLKQGRREIAAFRQALAFFEDAKVARGMEKLPDGVTHRPVFLIRSLLRQLPEYYVQACRCEFGATMPPALFCKIMAASYASRRDLRMTPTRESRAIHFQHCYQRLIAKAGPYDVVLRLLRRRSSVVNHEHRMTGNAIIFIVASLMSARRQLTRDDLQAVMDRFIESQVLLPREWRPLERGDLEGASPTAKLLRSIQEMLETHKETV